VQYDRETPVSAKIISTTAIEFESAIIESIFRTSVFMEFIDEYIELCHGAKIELLSDRLIVGDSPNHTKRLLHQILRGWSLEAAIVLAPEALWLEALTQAFGRSASSDLDELQTWANHLDYTPVLPPYERNQWRMQYGTWELNLRMAMYSLDREEHLGNHISRGVLNRLGNDALMPDNHIHLGTPGQTMYEYYLNGPAEWVTEWLRSGAEAHIQIDKRSRYQAAGVPELTILDAHRQQVEFLRLVDGIYQPQHPEPNGHYNITSIPGLTLLTDRLWPTRDEDFLLPLQKNLFEIAADAPRQTRKQPRYAGVGMSWHERDPFNIGLTPEPIAFDDFIYWTPESKFEFANGRPDIGGREGGRGLTGMALMTFGLLEVVPLFHPREWLQALVNLRSLRHTPPRQSPDWKLAQDIAGFLRDQYDCDRVAVSGDLAIHGHLTPWSDLVIVAWGLPQPEPSSRYANAYHALYQMYPDRAVSLVYGDCPDGEKEAAWVQQAIDLD
jgi:hypothetical protein